jgi:cell division septation protein DedD
MTNITITRTKNIANATFLPYAAYCRAVALATELEGKIGKTDKGFFKATFANAKIAEQFVATWTAEYEANRKPISAPAPKSASKPAKKTSSSKTETKATPSSTKKTTPRKAKGVAFDFSAIKGETKKDKNRALHAMLVSMGIKDSRTPEYMSVWNARPWAN